MFPRYLSIILKFINVEYSELFKNVCLVFNFFTESSFEIGKQNSKLIELNI